MIPSDHFVRFYNEVFKALEREGRDRLVEYWRELGRLQTVELADRFRQGGLKAAGEYWRRIVKEENCQAEVAETPDYLELRIHRCSSLSKVLDNDATPSAFYCDHCMGWVEPVMANAGLYAVLDAKSRSEPRCVFRVYEDKAKADMYERTATLPSRPYASVAGGGAGQGAQGDAGRGAWRGLRT